MVKVEFRPAMYRDSLEMLFSFIFLISKLLNRIVNKI